MSRGDGGDGGCWLSVSDTVPTTDSCHKAREQFGGHYLERATQAENDDEAWLLMVFSRQLM